MFTCIVHLLVLLALPPIQRHSCIFYYFNEIQYNLSVFLTVSMATHEIGHILGLQHSTDVNAIMYPFLNFGMTKRELSHDDIDGVLALYGTP